MSQAGERRKYGMHRCHYEMLATGSVSFWVSSSGLAFPLVTLSLFGVDVAVLSLEVDRGCVIAAHDAHPDNIAVVWFTRVDSHPSYKHCLGLNWR